MYNDYEIFSLAATGIVFTAADWNRKLPEEGCFSEEELNWLRSRFNQIAHLRNLLCGEFYRLTEEFLSLRQDIWCAYQAWNPEMASGAVVCFRRKDAVDTSRQFRLRNIEADTRYEITDLEGNTEIVCGTEIRNLNVVLEQPESVFVRFYKKLT